MKNYGGNLHVQVNIANLENLNKRILHENHQKCNLKFILMQKKIEILVYRDSLKVSWECVLKNAWMQKGFIPQILNVFISFPHNIFLVWLNHMTLWRTQSCWDNIETRGLQGLGGEVGMTRWDTEDFVCSETVLCDAVIVDICYGTFLHTHTEKAQQEEWTLV